MNNEYKGRLSEEEALEEAAKLKSKINNFTVCDYDTAEKILEKERFIQKQIETLKGLFPEAKQEGLRIKINEEFEKYVEGVYEKIRSSKYLIGKPEEVEKIMSERSKDFDRYDNLTEKLYCFTNNFHCWFDGGMYRKGIQTEEGRKLIADLDNIISKNNYGSIDFVSRTMVKELAELRSIAIADIFFKMLNKGYDQKELWK